MKRTLSFLALLLAAAIPAAAQNQTRERRVSNESNKSADQSARSRLVPDQRDANHVRQPELVSAQPAENGNKPGAPSWGDTAVIVRAPTQAAAMPAVDSSPKPVSNNLAPPKFIKPTTLAVNSVPRTANETVKPDMGANPASIYRVGIGDVLDVRLSNLPTRESTLFTVLKNGAIDYPLLDTPLGVAGMTPDEIAARISSELKVIRNARASVTVRDYASHSVVVTGAVDNPGQKIMRREAMPLFTILAQAVPRAEATTATISRNGKDISLSVGNSEQMTTLVMPGDAIRLSAAAKKFVYVGGAVASGGEKEFRDGMTLTQVLLASGGALREAGSKIKIFRRNASGFLVTQEYDLEEINTGKAPDPTLEPGDRIDLARRN